MSNNLELPVREVNHADLQRWSSESPFKSKCPACDEGVLLMTRDTHGRLSEHDRCIGCGQLFRYLDIAEFRKIEE